MPAVSDVKVVGDGAERFVQSVLHCGPDSSPAKTGRVALSARSGEGWREVTYGELARRSLAAAAKLRHMNIGPGRRVAIIAEPSPEWCLAFFAVIRAGAIVVPLDPKLTAEERGDILSRAEPGLVLCSEAVLAAARSDAVTASSSGRERIMALGDLAPGDASPPVGFEAVDRSMGEPAMIVFTSGTTGQPRGVVLSLANLAHQVRATAQLQRLTGDEVFLSILPLSHTFELTCGLLTVLSTGGEVAYSGSLLPDELTRAMREKRVTGMVVVPLFLKLIRSRVEAELAHASWPARTVMRLAAATADRVPVPVVRRILFAPVLRRFGGRLRGFYVGGAPLDPETAAFHTRMGLGVYQGYGLTETSPIVAMNTPEANRIGSVGRPLPGVTVRIDRAEPGEGGADAATEGEICVKGPNVMLGYYQNEAATSEAVDGSGWLHTGDLGLVDDDGFLFITGRLKNLIVLASGKKVQPEEVEGVVEPSELVREVCVLGRKSGAGLTKGTEEVVAVVVPSDAACQLAGSSNQLSAVLAAEVRRLVGALAGYKHPTKVIVWHEELPKTAIRKIRRTAVSALLDAEPLLEVAP